MAPAPPTISRQSPTGRVPPGPETVPISSHIHGSTHSMGNETSTFRAIEPSVPTESVIVSFKRYSPALVYVWLASMPSPAAPSPKSHEYVRIGDGAAEREASTEISRGKGPISGLTVNDALGMVHGALA